MLCIDAVCKSRVVGVSKQQKVIKELRHKHTKNGYWLGCFNTERGIYDVVFLSKDGRLFIFPTFLTKKVIDGELPVEVAVDTTPYVKFLNPEETRRLREQLDSVHSTRECHEFVNDLLCLEFGVCTPENRQEPWGGEA